MEEQILKHYALSDPFADKWTTIETGSTADVFSTNETDALGTGAPVARVLYDRGILRSDAGIPAEYSIESKTFDARAYVRNVHRKATQNDLLRGQQYIQSAIESKAGSLKVLVEENFDRFVSSKRVIDNVNSQIAADFSRLQSSPDSRLETVKRTLDDSSIKATQIFEPVIENHRKADSLRGTLNILEQYSAHFDLPSVLLKCIENNDNDLLLKEYKKGTSIFNDVKKRSESAATPAERRTTQLLARAWAEVEAIMKAREAVVWARLEKQRNIDNEVTAKLANFLLELGVSTNPYLRAYLQHNSRIKAGTIGTLERGRVRIEIMRRELLLKHVVSQKARLEALSAFVKSEISPSESVPNIIQSQEVLAFWDAIDSLVVNLWTSPAASIAENWKIVQDMTNSRTVKLLPTGPDGSSRRFHTFTTAERENALSKTEESIDLLCSSLTDFFVARPITQTNGASEAGEGTTDLPDIGDREPAEFSFIPVSVNSLGAASHLTTIMTAIMAGVSQLSALKISPKTDESLQKMITIVRERFIRAICELWQADSDDLPHLELWERTTTGDGTELPRTFWLVQKSIINGVSRIMFRNELVPLPSQRLLGNVRQQFVKNVYQVINGLMTLSYSSSVSPISLTTDIDIESKKLLTMTNLDTIQSATLLKLIQIIESTFAISLTQDLQKIKSMFTQYQQKLSTSFLAPRVAFIDTTIARDLKGIDWLSIPFPQDISLWTNECLLECVTTHALVSTRAPSLVKSILDAMILHIFSTLELYVSRIQELSAAGMLQMTLDLEFLGSQFGESMPDEAKTKLDDIFNVIESATKQDKMNASDKGEVKRILQRATRRWSVQANVFRGPLLAAPTRR